MTVNFFQVDGTHYMSGFQHWDLMIVYKVGWLEGNVTKYVTRHKKKKGLKDIQKARHYTEKLLEVVSSNWVVLKRSIIPYQVLDKFFAENELGEKEKEIFNLIFRLEEPAKHPDCLNWDEKRIKKVFNLVTELEQTYAS